MHVCQRSRSLRRQNTEKDNCPYVCRSACGLFCCASCMDRFSTTLATVAANASFSLPATASASNWSHALSIVLVNCLVTIVCACAMTCWAVALLEGRRQRRELRDKVGNIVSTQYWPIEGEVSNLLRVVKTMRQHRLDAVLAHRG